MTAFTEDQVHTYIYSVGLEALVKDCPTFDAPEEEAEPEQVLDLDGDEVPFELWRIIKRRAFEKLQRLHNTIGYAAQLMEAERPHGFCFIRKPWDSIPRFYRNSPFIVALNPFHIVGQERAGAITEQIDVEHQSNFSTC